MQAFLLDLGTMRYGPAFDIQERLLTQRMQGGLADTVIFQENPPTFTIGKSGSRSNVLAPAAELARRGIEVIEVSRGGDVTYHGPGQLIVSPLLYLGDHGLNGVQYMHCMEAVLLQVLGAFGLAGTVREEHPGVWLGEAKIGAVGIGVRHGFTFHGISLNVNLDLTPFDLINPCGVAGLPVTSMQAALGQKVPMSRVHQTMRKTLERVFGLSLEDVSWEELQRKVNGAKIAHEEGVENGL